MSLLALHTHRRILLVVNLLAWIAAATTSAKSLAAPPSEIARKVMPSVVLVTTENDHGEALARGSGFVVAEGVIATNLHVIRGASKAFVKVVNAETQLEVLGIVAENREWDLVLLAVKDLKAPPLPIGDSDALQIGDDVYAVGNPHGLEGTFSAGIVSSIRRIGGDALLQVTAPISPGSSGGPIVNKDAEVVGMAVASLAEGQNLNFAVSASYLKPMLKTRSDPLPLPGSDAEGEKTARQDGEDASDVDWSQIAEWVMAQAESGDPVAMFNLGMMYAQGWGVHHDDVEAGMWLLKAADLGNSSAMVNIGVRYAKGDGVAQDHIEAAKWFRKAADLGVTQAMSNLGNLYANGWGVAEDDREAVKWQRKAADAGYSGAMYILGIMYIKGEGVVQDVGEALKWLQKAAEQGSFDATYLLGQMYAAGRGVTQDDREAVKWYRKAADLGAEKAMVTLGEMYFNGKGVERDENEAAQWFRKASQLGNAVASLKLGVMYAEGEGVEKDDREALRWFRKAADLGDASAMCYLGVMYTDGRGVAQDDIEAYAWYSVSAAFGLDSGKELRDLAAKRLTSEARLMAQARAKEHMARIERATSK